MNTTGQTAQGLRKGQNAGAGLQEGASKVGDGYPEDGATGLQCCGAGAARSHPFWLEPEPEPKKLRSFGSVSRSGSIIKEDE